MRPAVVGVALLWFVAACGKDPRTQVMVVVDADESVRASIGAVRIAVFGGSDPVPAMPVGEGPLFEQQIISASDWPVTHAIIPIDNDARRRFRVDATALRASGDSEGILTVRAISGFVAGETRSLHLRFYATCVSAGLMCPSNETCGPDGVCVSAVDPPLGEWGRDGGSAQMDAGGVDGGDGGLADAGSVDAGPPPVPILGWSITAPPGASTRAASGKSVYYNGAGTIVALAESPDVASIGGVIPMTGTGALHYVVVLSETGTVRWARGFESMEVFELHDVSADASQVQVTGTWRGTVATPRDFFRLPSTGEEGAFAGRIDLTSGTTGGTDVSFQPGNGLAVARTAVATFIGGSNGTMDQAALATSRQMIPRILGDTASRVIDLAGADDSSAFAVGSVRAAVVTVGSESLYPLGQDGFVVSVTADGAVDRGALLGGPGTDHVHAVAVSGTRVYVAGELDAGAILRGFTFPERSAFVAVLDAATLDVLDYATFPVTGTAQAPLTGIAVRADGAVFVGGHAVEGGFRIDGDVVTGWVVIRLDADLDSVWQQTIPGASAIPSGVPRMTLAALPDGSVVATGAFAGDVVLQQIREEAP